ncbi:metallophosphoesterase [Actinoplanes sp. NEAU-A12]|uniref:Metallophosphoesterase n=1 Tax=Actinoplanes sandaracinus TaxID=3045177 RepID=A0ABT6WEL5_9ACTN|nr:metallophosphoesterase [Actinoplanes sandaracinus]MDI6098164.1 metallophosphoesterase [Actinoplanes sandaracinus]
MRPTRRRDRKYGLIDMRLLDGRPERLATIPYRAAGPGGVARNLQLAVERLRVDTLPGGCTALLATGDLQGIATSRDTGKPALLGIALAGYLGLWAESGLFPAPGDIAVLLTGDLYSAPDADLRGATGDVSTVWAAFAAAGCPAVVGIAGNHDELSPAWADDPGPGVALLDGTRYHHGDLTVAGVSGVIGVPAKPFRRTEEAFLATVDALTDPPPDVLLLHEGPRGTGPDQPGRATLRARLERRPPPLTLCGHVHWARPIAPLGAGHILNVDARAVLLTT